MNFSVMASLNIFPQILSLFSFGCRAYSLQFNLKIQNFFIASLKKFDNFPNFANHVKTWEGRERFLRFERFFRTINFKSEYGNWYLDGFTLSHFTKNRAELHPHPATNGLRLWNSRYIWGHVHCTAMCMHISNFQLWRGWLSSNIFYAHPPLRKTQARKNINSVIRIQS